MEAGTSVIWLGCALSTTTAGTDVCLVRMKKVKVVVGVELEVESGSERLTL